MEINHDFLSDWTGKGSEGLLCPQSPALCPQVSIAAHETQTVTLNSHRAILKVAEQETFEK